MATKKNKIKEESHTLFSPIHVLGFKKTYQAALLFGASRPLFWRCKACDWTKKCCQFHRELSTLSFKTNHTRLVSCLEGRLKATGNWSTCGGWRFLVPASQPYSLFHRKLCNWIIVKSLYKTPNPDFDAQLQIPLYCSLTDLLFPVWNSQNDVHPFWILLQIEFH